MDPQDYISYKIYDELLDSETCRILFSRPTMGIYNKRESTWDNIMYPWHSRAKDIENVAITQLGQPTRITHKNTQQHFFLNNSFEPLDYDYAKWFWSGNYLIRQLSSQKWQRYFTLIHNEKNSSDLNTIVQTTEISNHAYWFGNGYLASKFWYRSQGLSCFDNFMDRPLLYNFICMNRLIDDSKSWRIEFLNLLNLENGVYSLPDRDPVSNRSLQEISNSNRVEPNSFDTAGNDSGGIIVRETTPINTTFLHVVCETLFHKHKLFLTEKTFKPIVLGQPFVLVTGPGNLEYLRSYGFRTFSDFWCEDYDNIQDDTRRMRAIADIVNGIASMSSSELHQMRKRMEPTLMHNRRWFYSEFANNCWRELQQNVTRLLDQ